MTRKKKLDPVLIELRQLRAEITALSQVVLAMHSDLRHALAATPMDMAQMVSTTSASELSGISSKRLRHMIDRGVDGIGRFDSASGRYLVSLANPRTHMVAAGMPIPERLCR